MTSKRKQMESSFTQPEVNVFDFVIYQITFNPFIWIFFPPPVLFRLDE